MKAYPSIAVCLSNTLLFRLVTQQDPNLNQANAFILFKLHS